MKKHDDSCALRAVAWPRRRSRYPHRSVRAQQGTDWTQITGGYTSTRFSPLDQINASNFNTLKVAWEWRGEVPPGVEFGDINARSLPIFVDGMLLTTAARAGRWSRSIPSSGKTLWTFQEPRNAASRVFDALEPRQRRGLRASTAAASSS